MLLSLIIAEAVVIALLGLLVSGLLRSHAEILGRLHQLGAGLDPAPSDPSPRQITDERSASSSEAAHAHDIAGETPSGEAAAFGVVGANHDTLLAFLSSSCLTCADFWRAFGEADRLQLPARTRLLVVTKGADAESVSGIAGVAPAGVPIVMSTEAWVDYEIPGAPYFILVDGRVGRVIGEGTASRWDQVQSLMTQAITDTAIHRQRSGGHGEADRRERIDADLLAAGVGPGHASLYPEREPPPGEGSGG